MIIIELNFTGFSITETWYFVTLKKKKSMKKVLFSVLISSFTLLFPLLSKAQAGIFKVRLMVDKALTSSVMITTANQSVNAYSNFRFPSNLQDSIKLAIQKTAKTQLFKDATYIYDLKADGSKRATLETGTYAGGYPKMTKKERFSDMKRSSM
jgi:hypothetical protein